MRAARNVEAVSNVCAITGREGGLAPAACDSQETTPRLSFAIVGIVKQRGQAHLPDLVLPQVGVPA